MYDLRVVRFIKTTERQSILSNTSADYICLGHFDMMHIEQLGTLTNDPLAAIQQDRDVLGEGSFSCSINHVYSLYILKIVKEDEEKTLEGFWDDRESVYTVVTRIHCDYAAGADHKRPFSRIIADHCIDEKSAHITAQGCVKGIIKLAGDINSTGKAKADVKCVLYDSLELGDSVAIMKSGSLSAILEVVRHISSNPCVRDTYTYCGISRKLLQDRDSDLDKLAMGNAELPHVSTRFSVRNNSAASIFFEKLLKDMDPVPHFYVTGTADQIIQWGNCSENRFLKIMRRITQQGDSMYLCFNDVMTRVGIRQVNIAPRDDETPETEETSKLVRDKRVKFFQETIDWLKEDLSRNGVDSKVEINWKYSLLKLLGTLETMYANYVMDDLANLIIPSVDAFLVRLNRIKENNDGSIPTKYNEDILEFLRHWTSLTNDVSQLESQLTQHPELIPVRYYIPAMLLQFELRFVEYCCDALSDEGTRSFHPMLLPTDTEELYTYSPLDPKQEKYQGKCPLLVFIPLQDLYRPWQNAHRIAHEIAHYCGDSGRMRKERHEVLTECMAYFVANRWYRDFSRLLSEDEAEKLHIKTSEYASDLANTVDALVRQADPDVEEWYLALSKRKLLSAVKDIINNEQYFDQYLFSYDPTIFYKGRNNFESLKQSAQSAQIKLYEIRSHMDGLAHLCAECYADIAMVLLLECNFQDYYTCVYHEEYLRLRKIYRDGVDKPPFAGGVLSHIDRMGLVIYAIRGIGDPTLRQQWENGSVTATESANIQWIKTAAQFVDFLEKGSSDHFDPIHESIEALPLFYEFAKLGGFLRSCAHGIEEAFKQSAKRQEAKKAVMKSIQHVKDGEFDWEGLRQFLTVVN